VAVSGTVKNASQHSFKQKFISLAPLYILLDIALHLLHLEYATSLYPGGMGSDSREIVVDGPMPGAMTVQSLDMSTSAESCGRIVREIRSGSDCEDHHGVFCAEHHSNRNFQTTV
jgi:hypothetical protein